MIWVSPNIPNEELLDFNDDISFLYPKYTITSQEDPRIKFRVVSIQEYPNITNNDVPILTPLSIRQMKCNNVNTSKFTFPLFGYINLHLFQKRISFSGFGSSKQKLKDMSYRMGAIVEQSICSKTSLLVSKTLQSEMAQAALRFKVPVVQDKFIYDLFQSTKPIDQGDYLLKPCSGLTFTTSAFKGKERDDLIKLIKENGGTFNDKLYNTNCVVISNSSISTKKLKKAIDLQSIIITDNFKEVLSSSKLLGAYPPLIPSDLFNGISFFISPKLEKLSNSKCLELKILIRQNGGQVTDSISASNFAIQMDMESDNFSDSGSHKKASKMLNSSGSENGDASYRTPIWVERCVEEGEYLSPADFPLYVPTKMAKRPGNFFVSLTGFNKKDYLNLFSSLKWLDIKFNKNFTKSMTHLIAKKEHESKKTRAAADWDIPVVGVDWLLSVAEGSLTNEALSNPWSPKRSQKSAPLSSQRSIEQTNFIDLTQESDLSSSQNLPDPNPVIHPIADTAKSQRAPPSPKKETLQANQPNGNKPKSAVSFLDDDDDDDDLDLADDCYKSIISHSLSAKDVEKMSKEVAISGIARKENSPKLSRFSPVHLSSSSFSNTPNISPRKSQKMIQSQVSPKRIQLSPARIANKGFLTDDDDDDIDYFEENFGKIPEFTISPSSTAPTAAKPLVKSTPASTILDSKTTNNDAQTPNHPAANQIFMQQKVTANLPPSCGHSTQDANNASGAAKSVEAAANASQQKHVEIDKTSTISSSNTFQFKSNWSNANPTNSALKPSDGNSAQVAKPPKAAATLSFLDDDDFDEDDIADITAIIEASSKPRIDTSSKPASTSAANKTVQTPNQTMPNQEITQQKPLENLPPPSAIRKSTEVVAKRIETPENANQTKHVEISAIPKAPSDFPNAPIAKPPNSILHRSGETVLQPPKPAEKLNFLDNDNDDDDVFDELEDKKIINDAKERILSVLNRKRRRDGKRSHSSKRSSSKAESALFRESADSNFDGFESFTQRPVDNDNDEANTVCYEETVDTVSQTGETDDKDPLLSFLKNELV